MPQILALRPKPRTANQGQGQGHDAQSQCHDAQCMTPHTSKAKATNFDLKAKVKD